MAQCSSQLSADKISKVTDIVSAQNSFRFCVEYLGIGPNEFRTIKYDAAHKHHDTLFQCIELWKNKTEVEGMDARQELIELLNKVQEERQWFSKQDMSFMFEGGKLYISDRRKSLAFL